MVLNIPAKSFVSGAEGTGREPSLNLTSLNWIVPGIRAGVAQHKEAVMSAFRAEGVLEGALLDSIRRLL